jgi:hypothetical protein
MYTAPVRPARRKADVDICNLALSHVGVSTEIANLDTERSKEAQACRRFYEPTREEVLRAFAWPFATRFVDLQLVEEEPNDEWAYSYRYPATASSRGGSSPARASTAATIANPVPHRERRRRPADLHRSRGRAARVHGDITHAGVRHRLRQCARAPARVASIGPRVAGGDRSSRTARCSCTAPRSRRRSARRSTNEQPISRRTPS